MATSKVSHQTYTSYSPSVRACAAMRWPPWSSKPQVPADTNDEQQQHSLLPFASTDRSSEKSNPAIDWSAFTEPRTLIPTLILTSAILGAARFHRSYLRRYPDAASIPASYFRNRSIFGKVTSVGDGDNFRLFHTPGGRLAGWGWLPWKTVPKEKKELRDNTVSVLHCCGVLANCMKESLGHCARLFICL